MRLMTHSALLRKPDHPAGTLSIAAQQISRKSSRAVVTARSGVEPRTRTALLFRHAPPLHTRPHPASLIEIGRASCRERV